MRHLASIVLALAIGPVALRAQATPADSVTATLRSLFDAMRDADTARPRAAFLIGARVIPVAPQSADTTVGGLTVDAFVAFVGNTAGNPWIETMKNVDVRVSGGVAVAWFDYDVHRGTTLSHCGTN